MTNDKRVANQLAAIFGAKFGAWRVSDSAVYTLMAHTDDAGYTARQVESIGGLVKTVKSDTTGYTGAGYTVVTFTMPTSCVACNRGIVPMTYDCPDAGSQDHTSDCQLCAGQGVYTVRQTCTVCDGSGES